MTCVISLFQFHSYVMSSSSGCCLSAVRMLDEEKYVCVCFQAFFSLTSIPFMFAEVIMHIVQEAQTYNRYLYSENY